MYNTTINQACLFSASDRIDTTHIEPTPANTQVLFYIPFFKPTDAVQKVKFRITYYHFNTANTDNIVFHFMNQTYTTATVLNNTSHTFEVDVPYEQFNQQCGYAPLSFVPQPNIPIAWYKNNGFNVQIHTPSNVQTTQHLNNSGLQNVFLPNMPYPTPIGYTGLYTGTTNGTVAKSFDSSYLMPIVIGTFHYNDGGTNTMTGFTVNETITGQGKAIVMDPPTTTLSIQKMSGAINTEFRSMLLFHTI
jgi:hypothetical protein